MAPPYMNENVGVSCSISVKESEEGEKKLNPSPVLNGDNPG